MTVFSQSHLSELVRLNADPEVMRYFPATLSFEESATLLQRIIEHQRINEYSLFAIHLKESGAFVGWCGLMKVPFSAHFTPAVEVGWRLNKIFWVRDWHQRQPNLFCVLVFLSWACMRLFHSLPNWINRPSEWCRKYGWSVILRILLIIPNCLQSIPCKGKHSIDCRKLIG